MATAQVSPLAVVDSSAVLGEGAVVREFAIIRAGVVLGDRVKVGNYTILCGAPLEVGDDTRLNAFVYISNGTTIGKSCFVGPGAMTLNTLYPQSKDKTIYPVDIKDRVKLGARVVVMPGVTIEHDALIAAGSLVTKDVPAFAVMMGSPARVVGDIRDLEAYQ